MFLLGCDWSRFAMYAFPLVVPAAALALQRARHRPLPLGLKHPGPSLAFTAVLMTLTTLALWWPRLPVRHG
jgi:hypothetical protein